MAKKIEVGDEKPAHNSMKDSDAPKTDVPPITDEPSDDPAISTDTVADADDADVPATEAEIPAQQTASGADDTAPKDTPDVEIDEDPEVEPLNISSTGQTPRHHRLWYWLKSHKAVSVPLVAVVILGIVAAVPFTRYLVAGMVIRKDFTVTVMDSQTNKPVSSATVSLEGKNIVTDSQGRAVIHANVGQANMTVSKKYYRDTTAGVLVPFNQKQPYAVTLVATGRQVPVTVINKISGKPVENAKVVVESSEALTDKSGETTVVLPANLQDAKGTITADTFNKINITVKVTTAKDSANSFSITPAGKLYFLSNASGKIDVVKSDLDGQDRQTILPGTGKEDKNNTVLFASTDWKYLALLSKRESDKGKIYLIETDTDKVTTMDEGDASFTLVGWSGHQFVYRVDRNSIQYWQPKHSALKSFDAETKKLATLDETAAEGSSAFNAAYETMSSAYILDGEIVYNKNWFINGTASASGKSSTLNSVKQTAASKKVIKEFNLNNLPANTDLRPYGPNGVYISEYDNAASKSNYFEYEEGKIADAKDMDSTTFYSSYPTYLISPDGKHTFWTDGRDGKNALFIGDEDANGQKQVGLLKDYNAYGWYTDKYLLLSKDSSELYIIPATGVAEGKDPSKVSDYYHPSYSYSGYGRGYGGQ